MNKEFRRHILAGLGALVGFFCTTHTRAQAPATPKPAVVNPAQDPTKPAPGGVPWFMRSHGRNMARTANKDPIDLCFFGDSVTQLWEGDLFNKYYGKYHAVNFGVGGDKIQHLLWRVEGGELKGHSPKVIVLLIGTNNLGFNPVNEVVMGVTNMVRNLQGKFPATKILLLGIFPKNEPPLPADVPPPAKADTINAKRVAVNAELAKLDDKKMVRFLDLSPKFLDEDGKILGNVLKDGVHPTRHGFEIWAEAMDPLLTEMMGAKAAE